jgi:acetyl esterase
MTPHHPFDSAHFPFDSSHFDLANTSHELRSMVEALEKTMPRPEGGPATAERAEQARAEFGGEGSVFQFPSAQAPPELRMVSGPAGDVPVRIFRPAKGEVRGAMLHIHGGGWVIGSAEMNDSGNEKRANELGLVVASVDYRLAPEHPYPAGPDDCEAAALWLVENAESLGVDPEKIVIGGESAGGHLSAVTVVRMHQRHGFDFAGANLVYGLYDISGVPSHAAFDHRNVILNSESIDWFTRCFVPEDVDLRDPDLSPLYADLSGLCPALLTVGTLDPLVDHPLFLYARWVGAGNTAEMQVFPGAPHGFEAFPAPEGKRALARMDEFLARCLESS